MATDRSIRIEIDSAVTAANFDKILRRVSEALRDSTFTLSTGTGYTAGSGTTDNKTYVVSA